MSHHPSPCWPRPIRRALAAPDTWPLVALFAAALIGGALVALTLPRPGPIVRPPDLEGVLVEIDAQRATWAVVSGADVLLDPTRVYSDTVHGLRASTLRPTTVYVYADTPTLIDVALDADSDLGRGLVAFLPSGRRLWLPVEAQP